MKEQIKQSTDARFLHRLHCVLLVKQGKGANEVAQLFNDNPSSVARWVRHFNDFDTEGLRDDSIPGRPAKISYDQFQEISHQLRLPPSAQGFDHVTEWTGPLLATYLEQRYNITLSIRQCQRLLQTLH